MGRRLLDPKRCRDCGEVKPRSEFSPSGALTKGGVAVVRSICMPCGAKKALKWHRANSARVAGRKRADNLMNNYGLTVEQYEELLARQDGGCGICGSREGGNGQHHPVDHNHLTGRIRGILCHRCNRALGLLGDDIDMLRKAIKYLEAGDCDQ